MPRRTKSPTTLVVNFFMTAAVSDARQALEIARAIVDARAVAGGNGAAPRARRGRRRQEVEPPLPGMTAVSSAPATAPAAPARRRRGPGRATIAAASEASVSTLPPQLAPGEE